MRIAFALIASILGGCIVAAPPPAAPAPETHDHRTEAPPAQGGEAGPLSCSGNESIVLEDCFLEGDVALDAHGNCSVTLTNCSIHGSVTAIDVHGNASVVISNGEIVGPVAIDAHGNASITTQNTQVEGEVNRHGNASVNVY
jgi:hypothetical protein